MTTPGELFVAFLDGEILGTHEDEWAARRHIDDQRYLDEPAMSRFRLVKFVESEEISLG
jgi:hypothetical protein